MTPRVVGRLVLVGSLMLGSLVSAIWLTRIDLLQAFRSFESSVFWMLPLIAVSTLVSMGIRFLRWQYLLRVNGLLVPMRDSLSIYLAGFAMVLTPAHVGEIIKALLLRWRHGLPLISTIPIVIAERLFDLAAVILIVVISTAWARSPLSGVLAIALSVLASLAMFHLLRRAAQAVVSGKGDAPGSEPRSGWLVGAADVAVRVGSYRVAAVCLVLSVSSWIVAGSALMLSLAPGDLTAGPVAVIRVFAQGTALGAFSLLPAGVGVTGSVMILQLVGADIPLGLASTSVLLVRIFSVWLAVGIGVATLGLLTRRLTWPDRYLDLLHFDEVAHQYEDQIPLHLRRHILNQKISPMVRILDKQRNLVGVDLGCGQGWYATEVAQLTGHRVVAFDHSIGQIQIGIRKNGTELTRTAFALGDMLSVPVRDGTVDFAYSINAFHHIDRPNRQLAALREVARILKPGGRFFLHEMNVANSALRFYLSYLFPLLRSIDEGTELWLDPRRLPSIPELQRVDIEYFTFVPDFLPEVFLRPGLWLERHLEGSRLRKYSVHYMAAYVRS